MNPTIPSLALASILASGSVWAKDVSFSFTVDTAGNGITSGNAILQVGMYAQHGPGTTASGIWDDIVLSGPQGFSDNFDDRTLTDARIGNAWTWYDTTWATADCNGDPSGGFGPFSDGGGGPAEYNHLNNNFAIHGSNGGGYFRAGLEPAGNGLALNVYHNQYAVAACNEIKIFREITLPHAQLDGQYTFTATVVENQFTPIEPGNEVGVFFKVLNVDNGYSEAQYQRKTEFSTPAPAPAPPVSVAQPVPALPIWSLLGLTVLVGFFGLRRREK